MSKENENINEAENSALNIADVRHSIFMKRILILKQGIIDGDTVRDVLEVFPDIENKFRQRKTYDEYYFDGATVELTISV